MHVPECYILRKPQNYKHMCHGQRKEGRSKELIVTDLAYKMKQWRFPNSFLFLTCYIATPYFLVVPNWKLQCPLLLRHPCLPVLTMAVVSSGDKFHLFFFFLVVPCIINREY